MAQLALTFCHMKRGLAQGWVVKFLLELYIYVCRIVATMLYGNKRVDWQCHPDVGMEGRTLFFTKLRPGSNLGWLIEEWGECALWMAETRWWRGPAVAWWQLGLWTNHSRALWSGDPLAANQVRASGCRLPPVTALRLAPATNCQFAFLLLAFSKLPRHFLCAKEICLLQ